MSNAFQQYQDGPISPSAFGRRGTIGSDEIRNRLGYHKGDATSIPKHEQVRSAYILLANAMDQILPAGDEKDQWWIKLRESSMWANCAVAMKAPLEETPPTLL